VVAAGAGVLWLLATAAVPAEAAVLSVPVRSYKRDPVPPMLATLAVVTPEPAGPPTFAEKLGAPPALALCAAALVPAPPAPALFCPTELPMKL
jgi:hypothetical protein